MREFYWVDTETAIKAARRLGLSAFGAIGTICALAYTRDTLLSADDDAAAAEQLNCTVEEWTGIKATIIEGGDVVVSQGLILPAATWAKPEMDA